MLINVAAECSVISPGASKHARMETDYLLRLILSCSFVISVGLMCAIQKVFFSIWKTL